jgi:hypothetical protein
VPLAREDAGLSLTRRATAACAAAP